MNSPLRLNYCGDILITCDFDDYCHVNESQLHVPSIGDIWQEYHLNSMSEPSIKFLRLLSSMKKGADDAYVGNKD